MVEHPLLVFPEPTRAERARRPGGGKPPRLPASARQAARLAPQFQRLQDALDNQRVVLQDNTLGLQPEQVLVLETVGSIENFIRAVKRIEGLEWLGEFEREDLIPGDGFEDESDPRKLLRGQLFLIMTDQRALQQMQRLFTRWRNEPDVKFPYGLGKLRDAFRHLQNIRPWNAEDRIRETGILADWEQRLGSDQQVIPFEVELWFRSSPDRRQQVESYFRRVIESLGGQIVHRCIVPEISYHAVLGRISHQHVTDIVEQSETLDNFPLLQFDGIRHIRPVGQCMIRRPDEIVDAVSAEQAAISDTPIADPLVALFDGMPLTGHQLLDGRLVVDDPDGYEGAYEASERVHGTSMASLICHGDLEDVGNPTGRPVYARPIMKPRRTFSGQTEEAVPDDVLLVDQIHRGIRRLFESESGEQPAAPTVRIINLSVCDAARPLDREMSPLARLLDWLAWNYNILFIVSAGNHSHDLGLAVQRQEFSGLDNRARTEAIIKAVADDTRNRRLLSPAETINGITIGAVHHDVSRPTESSNLIDPYPPLPPETLFANAQPVLPSVYSAHGPGYRRVIKPDLLLPGGRQFLSERLGNTHDNSILEVRDYRSAPGQSVAVPGAPGQLDRTAYSRGTSNSAALASRGATLLYDLVEQIRRESPLGFPSEHGVVLVKALLVHGANWDHTFPLYESILKDSENGRLFKEYASRFLGYGAADIGKVTFCTDQRVTILGVGKLGDGDGDEFVLPLPPSLSSVAVKRRLTISLAWLTPINCERQNYRVAQLWFNPKQHNTIAPNRLYADFRAAQRGTVQHEVLEGKNAIPYQDGENIVVKVNCRGDAGDITDPVRYGLAVTLEVAEANNITIYQEVRDRLTVRAPIRTGVPA